MENNDSTSKSGIGAVGVVQIVFIILKATHTGVIGNWPWWQVMLPIICSIGLICFALCLSLSCICFITHCDKDKYEDKDKSNIVEVLIDPENQKDLTTEVVIK